MDGVYIGWLQDWLSLLLRWSHFIVGIAWIGASFYFNWLENQLERRFGPDEPLAGDLWAVHGGGFYYLQKYRVAPEQLPRRLHWFKFEAYFTWLTGLALLVVVYYWNPSLYLLQPGKTAIGPGWAIAIGLGSLFLSWIIYNAVCNSPLKQKPLLLALLVLGWFTLLAIILFEVFSGRAAYIHIGAAIGSVMVANVAHVIIPAQKDMVTALTELRAPDAARGENALLRSRHNNYLTLPVLFIMISIHYPATYGSAQGWVFLLVFSIAAIGIRHWFNIRHIAGHNRWVLPLSLLLMLALVLSTLPRPAETPLASAPADGQQTALAEGPRARPTTAEIQPLIEEHCANCHAEKPTFTGFYAPPLGVVLETPDQIESQAQRINQVVVVTRTMPLANMQGMTEEQRQLIAQWYAGMEDWGSE
ncbi:MAG TPA: urate hydroxylase PuuD [Xanthomonadales bacterium]|nr:urate hydroxylase PuuD [Xanthomonadales bacterium]